MKKVPFIQLPKDFLERPLIDDMVQEGGATAVGAYVILLLYLSHRRDCVGSFSYPTLRMLSLVSHKSVRYLKNVILNYGQFRVDEKGKSFTCPDLQRSFRIPETIQRLFTDDDEEGSESDSKLNDNSTVNAPKSNANSKFVRVPNIRARINRDKDKNERKKESTSSTQKKTAAVAADGFFNFGFNSSHPTKKGARRDGAGDATDGGDDKDGDGGGPAQAPPTRARAVQRKHNEALADEMMKDEEWLQSLTYITGVSLMTPEMRGTVKRFFLCQCTSKAKVMQDLADAKLYTASLLAQGTRTRKEFDTFAEQDRAREKRKRDAVHFKTVTNSNDRTVTYDDREYPKYLYAGFLQLTPGYDKWDKEGNHYDWKGRPIPKDAPAQASATHYWDEEEHRWITPAHPKVKCS
ncbi:MAG: hypothetical protein LKE41_12790 [Prevotella sp.]|jgi:hypothetical protein|nr:hypothetical protein [Prevotella sp.]